MAGVIKKTKRCLSKALIRVNIVSGRTPGGVKVAACFWSASQSRMPGASHGWEGAVRLFVYVLFFEEGDSE